MSDPTLLATGCAVSFIALGGAYIYIRECFTESRLRSHVVRIQRAERKRDESRKAA